MIRRKRNHIWNILDHHHIFLHSRNDISNYFNSYFADLFSSTKPFIPIELDDLFTASISSKENNMLCWILNAKDIKDVVWSMNPLKAPGPDGLSGIFYKTYWEIIGPQVVDFVQEFFQSRKFVRPINCAFIYLIPKIDTASSFDHFRLISLCSFCYK